MLNAASVSSTPYWMQPALLSLAPAQLAHVLPMQQAPGEAHGFCDSVMMSPTSPVGWFGSATPLLSWLAMMAVQVAALAAPTAPGVGQWSMAMAVSELNQRELSRTGDWKPSSKELSMKLHWNGG